MAIGETLRRAREAKGFSLDEVSRVTRVQPRMLAAIEDEAHTMLPPRPYTRGMVAAYAREVGLDPDSTVRAYVADLDAREAPPITDTPPVHVEEDSTPVFGSAALILTVVLIAAVVIALNIPGGEPPGEPQAVGTSGFGEPLAAASAAEAPPLAAEPAASAPEELSIVIEATGPAWVSASSDGARVLYRLLQPGQRETLRGAREIVLRVGDAGAVKWTVNGESRGAMGQPGEVRDVTLTRETSR